jgi:hypothetical protein
MHHPGQGAQMQDETGSPSESLGKSAKVCAEQTGRFWGLTVERCAFLRPRRAGDAAKKRNNMSDPVEFARHHLGVRHRGHGSKDIVVAPTRHDRAVEMSVLR